MVFKYILYDVLWLSQNSQMAFPTFSWIGIYSRICYSAFWRHMLIVMVIFDFPQLCRRWDYRGRKGHPRFLGLFRRPALNLTFYSPLPNPASTKSFSRRRNWSRNICTSSISSRARRPQSGNCVNSECNCVAFEFFYDLLDYIMRLSGIENKLCTR